MKRRVSSLARGDDMKSKVFSVISAALWPLDFVIGRWAVGAAARSVHSHCPFDDQGAVGS